MAIADDLQRIRKRPLPERSVMFFARLAFRGIYFPQMKRRHWLALVWSNRETLLSLCYEALVSLRKTTPQSQTAEVQTPGT